MIIILEILNYFNFQLDKKLTTISDDLKVIMSAVHCVQTEDIVVSVEVITRNKE